MAELKYEISERIAVLSEKGKWTKELNKVSWNDRPAKFDLRDWNHEDGKMGKGATLTQEEAENLKQVLNAIEL
jgi:hypothetical protein